jgi:acetolactate synthase-1/2/3 large subunit
MFAGIAVFEGNQTFNISHEFPCFLGYSPNKHLPRADVGLLVDVDVPWFPSDVTHAGQSFWAHIDVDTLKSASPMWTFPGNLRMQGDSGVILGQLLEALKTKATPKFKDAAQKRVAALTAERAAWRESCAKMAANKGKPDEINPHYLLPN